MKKTPDDLQQLGERIARIQAKEAALRKENQPEGSRARASRIGLRICADLLSAVVVGMAMGYVLDELLGTKPWCLVLFLIFGGAAGVLNVYRLAQQEENRK